jgi:hypothetical protein
VATVLNLPPLLPLIVAAVAAVDAGATLMLMLMLMLMLFCFVLLCFVLARCRDILCVEPDAIPIPSGSLAPQQPP